MRGINLSSFRFTGREKHIIDLQHCINLIILMKTVSKEKTDKKFDIFERAEQIKREEEAE